MNNVLVVATIVALAGGFFGAASGAAAEPIAAATMPAGFDVASRPVLATLRGVGAQIYTCKMGTGGLAWAFREPVATLLDGSVTVGRHYAGPNWDLTDGSGVTGKVAMTLPGATLADVALLKLDVVAHRGTGRLSAATTVLRLQTRGGQLAGACTAAGELRVVPYEADYLYLQ